MKQLSQPSESRKFVSLFAMFISVVVTLSLALLFHFGPLGIKSGDDRMLASAKLADASSVFIIAHRTGHFIDAYEVTLYRVSSPNDIYINWLGYEDGYWWGCNLKFGVKSNILEIHAFGRLMAEYDISTGNVKWSDKKDALQSYRFDDLPNRQQIPKQILPERDQRTERGQSGVITKE